MDITDFIAAKENIAKQKKELQSHLSSIFEKHSKTLFADHPIIVSFGWAQYTPYFNDGEECVFGTHAEYPDMNGCQEGYLDKEYREELGEDGVIRWDNAYKAVKLFLGYFDREDYREMFGDHVSVLVTRDGVTVEHYEHE